jgi:aspartate-semialdehyde dehydrogenase
LTSSQDQRTRNEPPAATRAGGFFLSQPMQNTSIRAPRSRIDVGILGATGTVGQQFIRILAHHPWFKPAWLAASERSEGKRYAEAATWRLPDALPDDVASLIVEPCAPGRGPKLVFSALDAATAREVEPAFARAGHIVVSNASSYRMAEDVPLLIPEVNADHLSLIARQRRERGWDGAIVTNPNCSTVVLAMALAPLRPFGIRSAVVTTLQAVSGAGYPGVPSLDILGNVIPNIDKEEAKIESETQKILGSYGDGKVTAHPAVVTAQVTRVPVIDGHTISASIALETRPSVNEIRDALAGFRGRPQELGLPTAPTFPIVCTAAPDRPQPRLDAMRGDGMTVTVGRIRECAVLGAKFVALGHNTIRGAAGAAVLNAELMLAEGCLEGD